MRAKKLLYSGHRHPITEVTAKAGVLNCSCCELDLSGPAFLCYDPECSESYFGIHTSCVELPQQIRHKSHPAHALMLRPAQAGGFNCNACGETGSGSSFNCSTCDYYLHVKCSYLPEVVKRDDHKHPLGLVYSFQNDMDDVDLLCDVCVYRVKHGYWAYCCARCDVVTHLKCSYKELSKAEETPQSNNSTADALASLEAQMRQQQLETAKSNMHRSQMHNMRMSQIRMGFIG